LNKVCCNLINKFQGRWYSAPAGYDDTYVFDVTWTDGHHNETGTLTVNGLGDGSNNDDISANGDS
jgi:hypothetical protein